MQARRAGGGDLWSSTPLPSHTFFCALYCRFGHMCNGQSSFGGNGRAVAWVEVEQDFGAQTGPDMPLASARRVECRQASAGHHLPLSNTHPCHVWSSSVQCPAQWGSAACQHG